MIKALTFFVNKRKVQYDSDENYLKRIRASMEALKLDGGGHIMKSPEFMKFYGSKVSKKEEEVELKKFFRGITTD